MKAVMIWSKYPHNVSNSLALQKKATDHIDQLLFARSNLFKIHCVNPLNQLMVRPMIMKVVGEDDFTLI
ncbi:hypothetical protein [Paenibacillus lautus]|uniref:hypothetical protein n=1 Tax=Paenibacillus lautus TaxID=1401 RepID=UPI001C7D94FB|nr:hypothetical protein [Paenibacillus lautus]